MLVRSEFKPCQAYGPLIILHSGYSSNLITALVPQVEPLQIYHEQSSKKVGLQSAFGLRATPHQYSMESNNFT